MFAYIHIFFFILFVYFIVAAISCRTPSATSSHRYYNCTSAFWCDSNAISIRAPVGKPQKLHAVFHPLTIGAVWNDLSRG